MGKLMEKMRKAAGKAKAKVAAKTAVKLNRAKAAGKVAGKAKAASKCKSGKCCDGGACSSACVLIAATALMAAAVGCATTGEQPARSQTMTNEFRDCVIVMAAKATVTNCVVAAEGEAMPTLEMFTQTQANEGSETISPTASPTNTTDVDASLDIPVTKTGGAKTVSSAISTAAKTAKEAVKSDVEEDSED